MAKTEANVELMVDSVYDKLFSIILTQDFPPGARLSVDKLSRELEVSQTPVRQALTRLQSDGLVVNKPNSGYRVSDLPTRRHLFDALSLRLIVEREFIALAVDNADGETFRQLNENLQATNELIKADEFDPVEFFRIDAEFHLIIAGASGNKVGAHVLSDLLRRSTVFRRTYEPGMPREVLDEHKAIYTAMQAGAKQTAVDKLTAHLTLSIERVRNS